MDHGIVQLHIDLDLNSSRAVSRKTLNLLRPRVPVSTLLAAPQSTRHEQAERQPACFNKHLLLSDSRIRTYRYYNHYTRLDLLPDLAVTYRLYPSKFSNGRLDLLHSNHKLSQPSLLDKIAYDT